VRKPSSTGLGAAQERESSVATTSDRTSNYAGAQVAITTEIARNTLQAGLYSFGQHDNYVFGAIFNDGSGTAPFSIPDSASGGVVEEYVSDNYKATSWLTLIARLRESHFRGQFSEDETFPRFGVAARVPKLNRGFYARFYQPPPLLTAKGPVVQFAQANNTAFHASARGTRRRAPVRRSDTLARVATRCGHVQDSHAAERRNDWPGLRSSFKNHGPLPSSHTIPCIRMGLMEITLCWRECHAALKFRKMRLGPRYCTQFPEFEPRLYLKPGQGGLERTRDAAARCAAIGTELQ
jgi:hypothetical protein